jgi:hypothetical protein
MAGHKNLFRLFEEKYQPMKEHACGQSCEKPIYEIKEQGEIGRQKIYKYENRILHSEGWWGGGVNGRNGLRQNCFAECNVTRRCA